MAYGIKKLAKSEKVYFIIGCALYGAAIIAALILWLAAGHFYPLDYLLLVIFLVIPITLLVSSFFIGRSDIFGSFKWLSLILYLATAPIVCLISGAIDFRMGLLSGVPAVIGLAIGHIFYIISLKKQLKKEEIIKPSASSPETAE